MRLYKLQYSLKTECSAAIKKKVNLYMLILKKKTPQISEKVRYRNTNAIYYFCDKKCGLPREKQLSPVGERLTFQSISFFAI